MTGVKKVSEILAIQLTIQTGFPGYTGPRQIRALSSSSYSQRGNKASNISTLNKSPLPWEQGAPGSNPGFPTIISGGCR